MDQLKIRYANKSDIPSLLPLVDQLGYPASAEVLGKRFEKFISANNAAEIAVAVLANSIAGCIAWSVTQLFVKDAVRFHIEALVVDKNHRKLGIGQALINFVEDIALKNRPSIIDLTSGIRRAPEGTHEFYKKLGFKSDGPMAKVYLRKELL